MEDRFEEKIEERQLGGEMQYDGRPVLRYEFIYPKITEQNGAQRLCEYFNKRARRKERYAKGRFFRSAVSRYKKNMKNGVEFSETRLFSVFHITAFDNVFFSLFEDDSGLFGKAEGQTVRVSHTWRLPDMRKMRLVDFFGRRARLSALIIEAVSEAIRKRCDEDETPFFEDWERLIRRHFKSNQFFLTEEGIHVFYQEDTIAPRSCGPVVFSVPSPGFPPEEAPCSAEDETRNAN